MSENPIRADSLAKRLLLLFPAQSYRVDAYVAAARRRGIELVLGTDLPGAFVRHGLPLVTVNFRDPESAGAAIVTAARAAPLDGIVPTNETTAVVAALAAERLGLSHAPPSAAYAARNKRRMRAVFAEAGVPSPRAIAIGPNDDPQKWLREIRFPCVVKPTMLTGSQGVIRADNPESFVAAVWRVRGILAGHGSDASTDPDFYHVIVEDYLPGREVAVEAMITRGEIRVLALFDKPDDLVGPYFEETLYISPSRLSREEQAAVLDVTERAARALGLWHGPVHAELRVDGARAAVVEIAARSIGGLCSRAFESVTGPLEDIVLTHAAGLPVPYPLGGVHDDDAVAAGVMMMPIPRSGILRRVTGLDAARAVPGVAGVTVAIEPGDAIRALPEGSSYLGFIFARGSSAAAVERTLRASFAAIKFELSPLLEVTPRGM
jgi:biotin carboxylase